MIKYELNNGESNGDIYFENPNNAADEIMIMIKEIVENTANRYKLKGKEEKMATGFYEYIISSLKEEVEIKKH